MVLSIIIVLAGCKGIIIPNNSNTLIETSGSETDILSANGTGSEEATNDMITSNLETTVSIETTQTTEEQESIQNTGSITKDDLLSLFKLKKDEVIKKLGDKYDIVFTGAEGSYEGYEYKELGITVCFDSDDTIAFIDCDEKVSIDGARTGMSFAQIQEKLGKSEVKETWIETPENKAYEITYTVDNCVISFLSIDKDGTDCGLSIYKSRKP